MALIRRIFSDGRLMGAGTYSDAVVTDMGSCYQVYFSGIAAVDPATRSVVGYEPHNGSFLPDALERQVEDIFSQLDRLIIAISKEIGVDMTLEDLTRSMVFYLRGLPLIFQRFNDAYISEFTKRKVALYPARTTVMKTTLPEPSALVEIQFEAVLSK